MSLLKLLRSKRRAMTFVEVLIAVFIIGVGVLPVLTVFLSGTRTVESGGVLFQVALAAQNIMDRARSDSFIWQYIPVAIKIPSDEDRGLYLPKDLVEKYKASADLKIDLVPNHFVGETGEPETRLYQIDVQITWMENGVMRNYSLMNYRSYLNIFRQKTSTRLE